MRRIKHTYLISLLAKGSGCELMYDNNDLSDSNKENNISPEDYDQKAKEQQQQEQHWAYKLFIEYPELYLPFLEQGKEKAVREVEGLCKIFDEYKMPKDSKF
jgi:hypothetical protein